MGRTSDHRRADSNHQEPTFIGGLCKTWCKQTVFSGGLATKGRFHGTETWSVDKEDEVELMWKKVNTIWIFIWAFSEEKTFQEKDCPAMWRIFTRISGDEPNCPEIAQSQLCSVNGVLFNNKRILWENTEFTFFIGSLPGRQKDNMYCHIQVKLTSINESGFWSKWFAMRQLWARPTVILSSNILFFILANKCASSSNINKNENFFNGSGALG